MMHVIESNTGMYWTSLDGTKRYHTLGDVIDEARQHKQTAVRIIGLDTTHSLYIPRY